MQRLVLVAFLLSFSGSGNSPTIIFEDVATEAGLQKSLEGMMGHAAAWGDFNNDGLADLFVGGFCDRPDSEYAPAKGPVATRLFRNLGNGKFEIVQGQVVSFCGRTSAAIFADLNQDGFSELYVGNNAKIPGANVPPALAQRMNMRSRLFQNKDGNFSDISQSSGASPNTLMSARNIGVLDYNLDGLLDLFVVEDKLLSRRKPRSLLLRNLGNLQFKVANAEAALPDDIYGLGMAIADLNEDGRADFFVTHSNRFFFSQGSRFREVAAVNKVFGWQPLDGEDWPSGAAFGDLNRDGKLDLVLSVHHNPARNKIFINKGIQDGVPQFMDVTSKAGLPANFPEKCPHVEIQDFDNDGWPDIYFSAVWKNGKKIIPVIYRNRGMQQNGLPRFDLAQGGKGKILYFPAGPSADFNGDGRLDLFLANWFQGEKCHLLKNRTSAGNWIQVKAPIGSKVKLISQNRLIGYQQVQIGFGYASGQLPLCHFGVGNLRSVDIEVRLPSGRTERKSAAAVNRRVEFAE